MEGKSEDILVDNFINVTVGRWWVHPLASFDTRNHSATPKWRPLTANRLSTIYNTGSSFFFFISREQERRLWSRRRENSPFCIASRTRQVFLHFNSNCEQFVSSSSSRNVTKCKNKVRIDERMVQCAIGVTHQEITSAQHPHQKHQKLSKKTKKRSSRICNKFQVIVIRGE